MAPTSRQQQILAALQGCGTVTIGALAGRFDVSDETIRRDLKVLSADGVVEKFHGGVRLSLPPSEPPFERRLREAIAAKSAIAAAAAARIADGATVLLDNSSSAVFLARELAHREPMTVLTLSLEVAQTLSQGKARHRIILPGGELRAEDRTITGAETIDYLSQFTPSYFVASMVAGSARGCFDFDLFEARFKRAMIPLAEQVMVLMDSSKFGRSGLVHVCDWAEVDILVSDADPQDIAEPLAHCDLVLAAPAPRPHLADPSPL